MAMKTTSAATKRKTRRTPSFYTTDYDCGNGYQCPCKLRFDVKQRVLRRGGVHR